MRCGAVVPVEPGGGPTRSLSRRAPGSLTASSRSRPAPSRRENQARMPPTMRGMKKVLLAAPRGYCAGVDRAVQMVERALDSLGAPVYVRKEIVHNKHVVSELEKRGAIFVETEDEIPEGSVCIFSAHGISPEVRRNAEARNLQVIDATCPLVTKVHLEAKRFARAGRQIVLVGHEG